VDTIREHIKHQLYHQQNELTQVKNHAQVELYSAQDVHAHETNKKASNVVEYQTRLKEVEISHYNFMVRLRRDHDALAGGLHEDFKRQFREVATDSERNVKVVRDEKETIMETELGELEEDKEKRSKLIEKKYEEVSAPMPWVSLIIYVLKLKLML